MPRRVARNALVLSLLTVAGIPFTGQPVTPARSAAAALVELGGEGGPSPILLGRPGPVQDVQATNSGDQVTLSWSPPLSSGRTGIEGYFITGDATLTVGPDAHSLTVSGLAPGADYSFSISAFNALTAGLAAAFPRVSIPAFEPAPADVQSVPARQPTNFLRSEDGRLQTSVGYYYSLQNPVPTWEAVLDMRMKMVQYYFDGHNPGVFTPLLSEGAGSYLDYWDGIGLRHRFRIVAVRSWDRSSGEPPPVSGAIVAQFQTCRTLDGSVDWVYDAVSA